MVRASETWTCTACGHVKHRDYRVPKYFPDNTPYAVLQKKARCRRCGARGKCIIEPGHTKPETTEPMLMGFEVHSMAKHGPLPAGPEQYWPGRQSWHERELLKSVRFALRRSP